MRKKNGWIPKSKQTKQGVNSVK
uniref:Uncharacterized protein n=1 Tax=Nelumbo nucifera TaxID=4432 RepID=A0A822Y8U8_NELNU|nr:TPA_asm: hypothetical protein HUJ06_030305 [Nelumbo nucifera]